MAVREPMRFTGWLLGGGTLPLGCPEKVTVKKDPGAADLLTAVFPNTGKRWGDPAAVEAYLGEKLFFRGVVDEIITSLKDGSVTLIARSRTALLLDNEAMPQTIREPSLSLLEKRFLLPLGFHIAGGDRALCGGELTVSRGTSVYSLLRKFCREFLNCEPVVKNSGEVYCLREYWGREVLLREEEISEEEYRCSNYRLLSEAVLRDSSTGSYSARFPNPGAEGITRVKYLENREEAVFRPELTVRAELNSLTEAEPGDQIRSPGAAGRAESIRLERSEKGDRSVILFSVSEGGDARCGSRNN